MAVKTETISFKVSPEEKEILRLEAEKEDITVSKLLYRKIFKGGKENGSQLENGISKQGEM